MTVQFSFKRHMMWGINQLYPFVTLKLCFGSEKINHKRIKIKINSYCLPTRIKESDKHVHTKYIYKTQTLLCPNSQGITTLLP